MKITNKYIFVLCGLIFILFLLSCKISKRVTLEPCENRLFVYEENGYRFSCSISDLKSLNRRKYETYGSFFDELDQYQGKEVNVNHEILSHKLGSDKHGNATLVAELCIFAVAEGRGSIFDLRSHRCLKKIKVKSNKRDTVLYTTDKRLITGRSLTIH